MIFDENAPPSKRQFRRTVSLRPSMYVLLKRCAKISGVSLSEFVETLLHRVAEINRIPEPSRAEALKELGLSGAAEQAEEEKKRKEALADAVGRHFTF